VSISLVVSHELMLVRDAPLKVCNYVHCCLLNGHTPVSYSFR
jgi:hypothetical protein